MADSKWEFESEYGRMIYSYCHVASDWNIKPSDLGICYPEDDPVLMAGYTFMRGRMEAWEAHVREQEQIRRARKQQAAQVRGRGRRS